MSGAGIPPSGPSRAWVPLVLRAGLGTAFLSAVLDRFGVWGPPGAANVAWGDYPTFTAYAARINPWAPAPAVPFLAGAATAAESVLAVVLLLGIQTRRAGFASGVLLLLFALGMTFGTGVKTALDASVFTAAAAGFALWRLGPGPFSVS